MIIKEVPFGRFTKDGKTYAIRREEGDTGLPRMWALENGYELRDRDEMRLATEQRKAKGEVATSRWLQEFGGFTDPMMNIFVRTDDRTRNLLNSAVMEARANPEFTVPNWKLADDSFITLTAEQIIYLYGKVWEFIAEQFAKEHQLSDAIDAAETVEAVRAVRWE